MMMLTYQPPLTTNNSQMVAHCDDSDDSDEVGRKITEA